MKRNLFLVALLTLVVAFASCQGQTGVQKVSVADFENKIQAAESEIILDVRTQGEYGKGHLPNSIMIDYYSSDFRQRINQLDKSKPVFVYCQSGVRSASAAKILAESGFAEVYDLKGGYGAWVSAKKAVVK